MIRMPLVACLAAVIAPTVVAAQPVGTVESVRACPQHGPGFYRVPGSPTCIRIGGRVATQYTVVTRKGSRDDSGGFGSQGRVSLDTRTDTAYGPLRSFVRVRVKSGSGADR